MHLKTFIPTMHGWGWQGGAQFKTTITDMDNGWEKRNGKWRQARRRYTLPYKHLDQPKYAAIESLFEVTRAELHAFLFNDGKSNLATSALFDTGDGVTTTFQLGITQSRGGLDYKRNVYALYVEGDDGEAIESIPVVTIAGSPTVSFTLDHDRGLITFTTAPADGAALRWSGPFAVWVRFNMDWMPFTYDEPNGIYGNADLIEVRPPRAA